MALKTGLFHSPETVGLLRGEAVDRFLRWREVERAVREIKSAGKRKRDSEPEIGWTKAQWEMEWMENHSVHVARRMREGTITQRRSKEFTDHLLISSRHHDDDSPDMYDYNPDEEKNEHYQALSPFDPLHLPSLFYLSFSLFIPLKSRVKQSVKGLWDWKLSAVQMAIVGGVGFCIGLGMRLVFS